MEKILIALVAFAVIIGCAIGVVTLINQNNLDEMLAYVDETVLEVSSLGTGASCEAPIVDENGNWCFVTDKDFKVMHLTDIHIGGGVLSATTDKQAIRAVAAMVKAENPDLVVITGDISFAIPTTGTLNNKYSHTIFIHLMEQLGVYWTVTLGNHDTEPYNFHNREAVSAMYANEDLKMCLYQESPEGVSGKGNHVINVKNSEGVIVQSLFMLDSHSYVSQDFVGGLIDSLLWNYDNIKQDQIDWYADMIELYNPQSSLMFFHIPLVEVKTAYDEYVGNDREFTENVNWFSGHDGEKDDVVYPSKKGDELFEKIVELGNTSYIFCGHDHFNNFVINYKGVMFSYGYSIDYMAYGDIGTKGYQRGCTIIEIDSTPGFLTVTHENYYQEKYDSLDEKENMNMDKDAYKGE